MDSRRCCKIPWSMVSKAAETSNSTRKTPQFFDYLTTKKLRDIVRYLTKLKMVNCMYKNVTQWKSWFIFLNFDTKLALLQSILPAHHPFEQIPSDFKNCNLRRYDFIDNQFQHMLLVPRAEIICSKIPREMALHPCQLEQRWIQFQQLLNHRFCFFWM